MNKKILGLALVAAFSTGTAQAYLIDDFDGGVVSYDSDKVLTSTTYSEAFGGERSMDIIKTGGIAGGTTEVTGPGKYTLSFGAGIGTSNIFWSDDTGINLLEGLNNNAFILQIEKIDKGDINFNLTVTDILNETDTVPLIGAGVGSAAFAFSSFSSAIDFSQIKSINLEVVTTVFGADLTIDLIETTVVPEPTSIALLMSAFAAFGFTRRKLA